MCERAFLSQQAITLSEARGLHSFRGSCFNCINASSFSNCVCVFFIGPSWLRSKDKGLRGWDFCALCTVWYAWVSAITPQGLELCLASFVHHFHQWIILPRHYFPALRVFDVWFDTVHWFINAVLHLKKNPFLMKCQTFHTTFSERSFFAPSGWGFVSLRGQYAVALTYFHTWHRIFTSPSFHLWEMFRGLKTGRAIIL